MNLDKSAFRFWLGYVVVVALCIAVVALRGEARLIAFVGWAIAAVVDVILLVVGVRR